MSNSLWPHELQQARLPWRGQTHVHCVSDAIQCSHPLSPTSLPGLSFFQHQCLCQWVDNESTMAPGDQSIGASASILPVNIQGWFPSELTGLISLLSKDSQESSPATQFESVYSSVLCLLYSPALTSIHDYWQHTSVFLPGKCYGQRSLAGCRPCEKP